MPTMALFYCQNWCQSNVHAEGGHPCVTFSLVTSGSRTELALSRPRHVDDARKRTQFLPRSTRIAVSRGGVCEVNSLDLGQAFLAVPS